MSLRIYVADDPYAPWRDTRGCTYYEVSTPESPLEAPEILEALLKRGTRIIEFAVREPGHVNIGRGTVPLMSSVQKLAWGIRAAGRIYVRGCELPAVVMVYHALLPL